MLHFRHGSAKYTNGGRYEGDFKCEHRWGWGRHIYPGGDHYEGQWIDDKIQGVCRAPALIDISPPDSTCTGAVRSADFVSATAYTLAR